MGRNFSSNSSAGRVTDATVKRSVVKETRERCLAGPCTAVENDLAHVAADDRCDWIIAGEEARRRARCRRSLAPIALQFSQDLQSEKRTLRGMCAIYMDSHGACDATIKESLRRPAPIPHESVYRT